VFSRSSLGFGGVRVPWQAASSSKSQKRFSMPQHSIVTAKHLGILSRPLGALNEAG